MRWSPAVAAAVAAFALVTLLAAAPSRAFEAFLGDYVGAAELTDVESGAVEARDVTTTIERFGEGGFKIRWTSVILVDGRRDVRGVRRVVRELAFEPAGDGGYFLQAPDYDPFRLREPLEPMAGDALAWATVAGERMDVFVFALRQSGASELQHHRRTLTALGLELAYRGLVDVEIVTRGAGRMVRVD